MESWEFIQRTLYYIEDHLSEKIQINDLAEIACLSPFYYQRLFSRLVEKPVMEYVRLRRLARAALLLENTDKRIIDVGLSVGFENHETFSRSFKNAYNLTPDAYRRNPRPLTHYNIPDISMKYRLIDENMPLIADGIVLEVSRRNLKVKRIFAGLSIEIPFSKNPSIDSLAELWNDFHKKKKAFDIFKHGGNEIGVGSPGISEGRLCYFVGAEVETSDNVNSFTQFTMPEGDYIVCSFESENFYMLTTNALDKAVQYMYGTWLIKNEITTEPFMAEFYFDIAPESSYMEIWFKIC